VGVDRAVAWGLRTRPVEETVADTWAWLQAEGYPESVREGRVGMDAAAEAAARVAVGLGG
jgi:hypothetical protein